MANYRQLTDSERTTVLIAKQDQQQEFEAAKQRMEALNRLRRDNEDFNLLFMEGYLKEHALRNVRLRSRIVKDEKQMLQNEFELNGVAAFNQYLISIEMNYNTCAQAIKDFDSLLDGTHPDLEIPDDEEQTDY